jgi:hypothetical protein
MSQLPVPWITVSDEVTVPSEAEPQAEAEWARAQSRWAPSWRGGAMLAIPLVYLVYVVISVEQNSHGAAAVTGYVLLAVFAACWLVTPFVLSKDTSGPRFWAWYALLAALTAAEVPFARAAGFALCVYLTMLIVARLGVRSAPFVAAMSVAALLVPVAIGSWHVSLGKSFGDITPVALPVVALAMAATLQVIRANEALAETRAELARVAAENERIRIARDLHDLLGHSLTTIPPGRWTRSARSRNSADGCSPRSGPRCPATARSPWPASWPAAGSCCGSPGSPLTCPRPPRWPILPTRSCSAGPCERG